MHCHNIITPLEGVRVCFIAQKSSPLTDRFRDVFLLLLLPLLYISQIMRLHNNVATMLATASTPPPASQSRCSLSGSIVHGDSDDECTDDELALGVLRDNLRSTTEKFFERVPPEVGDSQRRASSLAPTGRGVAKDIAQTAGVRHDHSWHESWNGLANFEKGVGGIMRRPAGLVLVPPQRSVGCGVNNPTTPSVREERTAVVRRDRFDGAFHVQRLSGADGLSKRQLVKRSTLPEEFNINNNRRGTPRGIDDPVWNPTQQQDPQQGARAPRKCKRSSSMEDPRLVGRRGSPISKETLLDLRVRSEEATRNVEAMKALMVEDGKGGTTQKRDRGRISQRYRQPAKSSSTSRDLLPAVTSPGDSGSNRVPQLIRAVENLQKVNAELNAELARVSGRSARTQYLKSRSSSSLMPRQRGILKWRRSREFSLGKVTGHHVQSSCDLLARRRSEKGQAEPMSCGVPRYRTQVTNHGTVAVYFELAITQAKSTWTIERRLEEFLDLRRSLVKTAVDLAKADLKIAGPDGIAHGPDYFMRVGEVRVPELDIKKPNWFERSSIRSLFRRRSREEMLAEKQVILASWLAKVLADSKLMSADLVRFLGGDVAAQPVVADILVDAEATDSWGTSDSESLGDEDLSSDFEDNEYDNTFGDSRGSLCSPREWTPRMENSRGGQDASERERSSRTMVTRAALARLDVPTFPQHSQIISTGRKGRSTVRATPGRGNVVGLTDAKAVDSIGGGEEDEYDDEGQYKDVGGTQIIPEPTVPPSFAASRRLADAPTVRELRAPSPSSPAQNLTLDAFFRAPA